MKSILISDIENSLGFEISSEIKESILKERLTYSELEGEDLEKYILEYLKVLDEDLSVSGEHRRNDWESGWGENLKLFLETKDEKTLIPKYHGKSNIARLNGRIIRTYDQQFDFKLHSFIVDSVIRKHAPNFKRICEFGCGTGYHLFRMSKYFPDKNFVGLDWSRSSQRLISEAATGANLKVSARNFDYFNPDESFDVNGDLILTVASLEQIGDKHKPFVDYLISKKPGLCIHFEPISEVFDKESNLLDHLTSKYFDKRNYLKGFLSRLKELESENKIQILETRRLNYGSKFIEGHTLIIWKPI